MNAKRAINLSLVLFLTLYLADAQTDKKLLGAWKTTIDYETYTLEFISETEISLNGEKYSYILSDSNIVVDYEKYLFKIENGELMIKWPGETVYRKYTRVKD